MSSPDRPSTQPAAPPAWAESLLRLLLRPANEESVAGDLLEEYRATVRPERGEGRANAWYLAQVAGFLWRLSGALGAFVAAQFVMRDLLDTFAPPADYYVRSAVTTYLAIATYLAAGFYGGYRTERARTGILVTVVGHAIGHGLSIVVLVGLFFAVIRNHPVMLLEFERTGGWGEALMLPVMLLPIVAALGTMGGVAGKYFGSTPRRRRVAG